MLLGFGLDMPKPGAILSDQCRIFANLFMVIVAVGRGTSTRDVDVERRQVSCLRARKEGFGKLLGSTAGTSGCGSLG
jgi:hypothetical protein